MATIWCSLIMGVPLEILPLGFLILASSARVVDCMKRNWIVYKKTRCVEHRLLGWLVLWQGLGELGVWEVRRTLGPFGCGRR